MGMIAIIFVFVCIMHKSIISDDSNIVTSYANVFIVPFMPIPIFELQAF